MKNRPFFLLSLLLLAAGFGCSDKPSKPDNNKEPYYKLIYSYVMPEFSILTFNSRTGEVLDSVWYPKVPYWDLVFSKDAARAYYSGSSSTWITDVATGDTVAIDRQRAGKLVLSPDENYVVIIGARSMTFCSLPNFEILYQKSATSIGATFHPFKSLLYFFHAIPNTMYHSDTLFVLDYGNRPVSVQAVALKDSTDELVPPGPMVVSGDGRWMIMLWREQVFLLDTDSLKIRKTFRAQDHWGYYWPSAVDPDRKQVYLAYVDAPLLYPVDAGIDIFDFQSLTLTRLIHYASVPGISKFVVPSHTELTPDGKELLGVSHNGMGSMEGFFRIDLATKTISLFAPERAGYPSVFAIDPRPYYD